MEILKAMIFGIIEGITEWLPISSTGHMIILDEFLKLSVTEEFKNLFLVVIQLGAIMAVVILFWNKLWPFAFTTNRKVAVQKDKIILWIKIVLACIPAAIVGILFDSVFEKLFYHAVNVALALIIFGIALLVIERRNQGSTPKVTSMNDLSYSIVFWIGMFQLIAVVFPGTSRSGATIVGALLLGVSRSVASEFTFCLAVPVMFGASFLKIIKYGFNFTGIEVMILVSGMITAFVVSMIVIKVFMKYVKEHNFNVFGWYRIVLGIFVLLLGMFGIITV